MTAVSGQGHRAQEPDAAPAYDALYTALTRLASEDWLGTQGYDGDELQRRVEFARDKLAALPVPGPQPGGWDALAVDIESLAPGDGITVASTILAQVCRAVTARLTGIRPEGEVSVWIDTDDDGAKVTVAWGTLRGAEKAVRGE